MNHMDTNLLKKLREKEGFTQEEVAEKLRVTVNNIEKHNLLPQFFV